MRLKLNLCFFFVNFAPFCNHFIQRSKKPIINRSNRIKKAFMTTRNNKNQEMSINKMWHRNLSAARNIRIDLSTILDDSYNIIQNILNTYVSYNDTDPIGLLLSLMVSIGHFAGNSTVNITNHSSNLNLFLLLVGPSGNLSIESH